MILAPFWSVFVSSCKVLSQFTSSFIMERDEIENLVGDRVRAVVSERQNELLHGINTLLSAKLTLWRKISVKISRPFLKKQVREKSRECHNHKPQPFPDPKRKRKPANPNKHKSNKRTKITKISSLFPKRGNRNTKRTKNTRTK